MALADKYREMTVEQLHHELLQARRAVVDAAVKATAGSDEGGGARSILRRDVARIRTVIAEKTAGT